MNEINVNEIRECANLPWHSPMAIFCRKLERPKDFIAHNALPICLAGISITIGVVI